MIAAARLAPVLLAWSHPSPPPALPDPANGAGFYVLQGTLALEVSGNTVAGDAGSFLYAPAGSQPTVRALSPEVRTVCFTAPPPSPSHLGGDPTPLVQRPAVGLSQWYFGHLLSFLVEGRHTGGQLTVIEALGAAGGEPPPHIHHWEDELYYLLEGEATFRVGDHTIHAGPGDTVFLPQGIPHGLRFTTPTVRALIALAPSGLEGYFQAFCQPAPTLTLPPPPERPYDPERILRAGADYGIEWRLGGE